LGLKEYPGSEGLLRLLEMLTSNEFSTQGSVNLIKRLHIPGHEKPRGHYKAAIGEGIILPSRYEDSHIQGKI
jgi:hypothetical protein